MNGARKNDREKKEYRVLTDQIGTSTVSWRNRWRVGGGRRENAPNAPEVNRHRVVIAQVDSV